MKDIKIFEQIFEQYKKEKFFESEEERLEKMIEYVYESNKLEGNKLDLIETREIITEDKIIGKKSLRDYLEAKGHFKALENVMMNACQKKQMSEELIKSFNRDILGHVWILEKYCYNEKQAGQKLGAYKVKENRIYYNYEGRQGRIEPESSPENVEKQMNGIINDASKSEKHIIQMAAEFSYKIFINQPFVDGNKRTSRLLATFMTMREGLPLVVFNNQRGIDYNGAMLLSYLEKEPSIFVKFLTKEFSMAMEKMIKRNKEINKNTKKAYSLTF